jgi:hypothetical protein
MPRVTLPVVTHVTSDWSNRTPKTPNLPDTCHCLRLPRVLYGSATCHRMDLPHVIPWCCHITYMDLPCVIVRTDTCPVRTVRTGTVSIQNFACLAWRTECDIFSIRTPFEKKIIPPESGRRDRCNGVSFIKFRALSFLSIFHALTGL